MLTKRERRLGEIIIPILIKAYDRPLSNLAIKNKGKEKGLRIRLVSERPC